MITEAKQCYLHNSDPHKAPSDPNPLDKIVKKKGIFQSTSD